MVVSEDLVRRPLVQYRQGGASLSNRGEFFVQRNHACSSGFPRQPLAKSDDDGLGQRFARFGSQFSGESIGIGVLDTECHI